MISRRFMKLTANSSTPLVEWRHHALCPAANFMAAVAGMPLSCKTTLVQGIEDLINSQVEDGKGPERKVIQ